MMFWGRYICVADIEPPATIANGATMNVTENISMEDLGVRQVIRVIDGRGVKGLTLRAKRPSLLGSTRACCKETFSRSPARLRASSPIVKQCKRHNPMDERSEIPDQRRAVHE